MRGRMKGRTEEIWYRAACYRQVMLVSRRDPRWLRLSVATALGLALGPTPALIRPPPLMRVAERRRPIRYPETQISGGIPRPAAICLPDNRFLFVLIVIILSSLHQPPESCAGRQRSTTPADRRKCRGGRDARRPSRPARRSPISPSPPWRSSIIILTARSSLPLVPSRGALGNHIPFFPSKCLFFHRSVNSRGVRKN